MPRTPRVEYENAVYHVMARGDRREAIVHDDGDRQLFSTLSPRPAAGPAGRSSPGF